MKTSFVVLVGVKLLPGLEELLKADGLDGAAGVNEAGLLFHLVHGNTASND